MTVRWAAFTCFLWTALAWCAHAQAPSPSFDCTKASGEIEQLVCKDPELAALDRNLVKVYERALKNWPADVVAEQKTYQRGWIKGRNDCWKADDKKACAKLAYQTRMVEIQIKSGQLTVSAPVGYVCTGSEHKPFVVTFYNDTDPPSAVLTYGDDQVIAFVAPSGSGAKYTAAGVEFWEHQGEATVDWFGIELKCASQGTQRHI